MKDIKTQAQHKLMDLVIAALKKAIADNVLQIKNIPDFYIEVPQDKGHGDFAANIAMILAREAKMLPRKIGEAIVERIDIGNPLIEKVEVAGPGFINFYLAPTWANDVIFSVLKNGAKYGQLNLSNGKKVQVEFVSANPTGPMHMGNARGAALGDALASAFEMAGYDVSKEFYINDAGNQIENFGLSLETRYLELLGHEGKIPEGGYHGEDIREHMQDLIEQEGERFLHMDSPVAGLIL